MLWSSVTALIWTPHPRVLPGGYNMTPVTSILGPVTNCGDRARRFHYVVKGNQSDPAVHIPANSSHAYWHVFHMTLIFRPYFSSVLCDLCCVVHRRTFPTTFHFQIWLRCYMTYAVLFTVNSQNPSAFQIYMWVQYEPFANASSKKL